MLVRFFIESENENKALQIIECSLKEINGIIIAKEIEKVEQYWKTENTYVIEMQIELHEEPQKNTLQQFLNHFCDTWLEFGTPINELLATANNGNCKYMKACFQLIMYLCKCCIIPNKRHIIE